MIDILNHYTLGFDQDRHIESFSPWIKCRACLAPYKLSGYGAVAKAIVNIFCFLKNYLIPGLPGKFIGISGCET